MLRFRVQGLGLMVKGSGLRVGSRVKPQVPCGP